MKLVLTVNPLGGTKQGLQLLKKVKQSFDDGYISTMFSYKVKHNFVDGYINTFSGENASLLDMPDPKAFVRVHHVLYDAPQHIGS